MRRQHFAWTYLVLTFVLLVYGTYSLIYNFTHDKGLSVLGLVFVIVGGALFLVFLVLFIISYKQKPKPVFVKEEPVEEIVEAKVEEPKEEKSTPKVAPKKDYEYVRKVPQNNSRYDRDSDAPTYYISKVGYGPVLRVTGSEILDMRSNTYYRIEGNMVKRMGSGPVFEISGNRIRDAFGGYLYEISGDSVNKIYGGFYASLSGSYLTTFDLKEKYEVPGRLNIKQQLAVVALLFGSY